MLFIYIFIYFSSATSNLIGAKDHASVQISIAEVCMNSLFAQCKNIKPILALVFLRCKVRRNEKHCFRSSCLAFGILQVTEVVKF